MILLCSIISSIAVMECFQDAAVILFILGGTSLSMSRSTYFELGVALHRHKQDEHAAPCVTVNNITL